MVLTVPVSAQRRVTVALSTHGVSVVPWRETGVVPDDWDDPSGTGGVREPRRPVAPHRCGAVAAPLD